MATTGILPTYQRFLNGAPVPSSVRRSFRPREKYLIVLVFFTFGVVSFGAFFFLPEFKTSGTVNSVYTVYKHMQRAGPDLLIPAPPRADEFSDNAGKIGIFRHNSIDSVDPHRLEDRAKLLAKIEQDLETDRRNQKVLERPDVSVNKGAASSSTKVFEPEDKGLVIREGIVDSVGAAPPENSPGVVTVPPSYADHYPNTNKGQDSDPVARMRRAKVLEVYLSFSYFSYDSILPISKPECSFRTVNLRILSIHILTISI
jgi:mannosyl-oligosaccharide alpha-1,2-mannosidase